MVNLVTPRLMEEVTSCWAKYTLPGGELLMARYSPNCPLHLFLMSRPHWAKEMPERVGDLGMEHYLAAAYRQDTSRQQGS